MKKVIFILLCFLIFASCRDKKSDCIKWAMDEYDLSYEEAKTQCQDAQYDSQIR